MGYYKRIEYDKYGRLTVYRSLDEPGSGNLWQRLRSILRRTNAQAQKLKRDGK